MKKILLIAMFAMNGCASTSGVMEAEGGTYLISASAAPARGGTAGANQIAHEEAQKFCSEKGGKRAIVVTQGERDVLQGGGGASWNQYGGTAGGGMYAAGRANLRFRCE